MSGGTYDYYQYHIRTIWETIEREIERNEQGFNENTLAAMRYGVELLRFAEIYAHRVDYLLAGDDGEEQFLDRLIDDIKALMKEYGEEL